MKKPSSDKMRFRYTICNEGDAEIFCKQCAILEKRIPGLQRKSLLQDIDGSEVRIYVCEGKTVKVSNSYYLGGVFIDSEIDIEQYFKKSI